MLVKFNFLSGDSMRERTVEQHLRSGIEGLGLKCIKYSGGDDGMPDRMILLPESRVLWVELKTKGGRLSPVQLYQHRRLAGLGHEVKVVWTCEQADELIAQIKQAITL